MWKTVLAVALLATTLQAQGQSASAGASAPSAALFSGTIAQRYADLAGSPQDAEALVAALRDGREFALGGTTYYPPAVKMSDANIENALALTRASLKARSLDKPTPYEVGTTLMDVLEQRIAGKRWPEVAESLGFKSPK